MSFEPCLSSIEVRLRNGLVAYQVDRGDYWIDFIPNGPELVVTFENAGTGGGPDSLRDCWGLSYLKNRNVSVLGVKWKRLDWYRGKTLHQFFRSEDFQRFAAQFTKHIFMGGSMGGYAALAFSQVLPGSLVIAHNPQTTLDTRLVPWEKRFEKGRQQDWTGDFSDTASAASFSKLIYLTYDPFDIEDRRHVERVRGQNVVHLKMPFMGHATPEWLLQMKILSKVTDLAMNEELTVEVFAKLMRPRRTIARYYICMYLQTKKKNAKELALSRGLQITPLDTQLLSIAFTHYFSQNQYELCIELYQRSLTLHGLSAAKQGEIRALAGIAMHRTKYPLDQIVVIANGINGSSKNVPELIASAGLLNEIGRFDAAALLSETCIRIAPRVHDGYWSLAISQRAMLRPHDALTTIEAAEESCGSIGNRLKELRRRLEQDIKVQSDTLSQSKAVC